MSTHATFSIPVHDLGIEGRDAQFPITASWLRGAMEGCEMQPAGTDGALVAHLIKTGNEILVQGQIDVSLVVPCARCLRPVELRPHIELSLLLFPAPAAPGPTKKRPSERRSQPEPEVEFAAEEAETDTYDGDEVVLDKFVREAILLDSPTFPLCSEACEGIRPAKDPAALDEDVVTDPRLRPLLELAKRRPLKE
jgi:uncharacterized protein